MQEIYQWFIEATFGLLLCKKGILGVRQQL